MFTQELLTLQLHFTHKFVGGQGRGSAIENGIGFDSELIPGQMSWLEFQCAVQVVQCRIDCLLGKTMHEIEIKIFETGVAGNADGTFRLCAVMNPTQLA